MSAHKHRRLCWSNDGSDTLSAAYGGHAWPIPFTSAEHFINCLMKFVAGTDINAIFYNGHTNEPVWEVVQHNQHAAKNIAALGPNPEQPVLDFTHGLGMEFFYSIRMNDIHASYYTPKHSYWPPFRLAHPELLIGYVNKDDWHARFQPWIDKFLDIDGKRLDKNEQDSVARELELRKDALVTHPLKDVFERVGGPSRDFWSWASYDYAKPAVHKRYLDVIDEACKRYDLDGIELDWCRMAMLFRKGEETKSIPIMNDFIHQVHNCLVKHGKSRGRPILLTMRVPDSIARCLHAGLDPVMWARQGWVDMLSAGTGLMPFSIPIKEWVDLGKRYNVGIYGSMDRVLPLLRTGRPKWDSRDPEVDRDAPGVYDAAHAAAARLWNAGVDGIALYDWHTHHGPTDPKDFGKLPPLLAHPDKLPGANKIYQIDYGYAHTSAHAYASIDAPLPCRITTEAGPAIVRLAFELVDDPQQVSGGELHVQWQTDNGRPTWQQVVGIESQQWQTDMDVSRVALALNGQRLGALNPVNPDAVASGRSTTYRPELTAAEVAGWYSCAVPPSALRRGDNELEVTLQPPIQGDASAAVELLRVRLGVQHKRNE